MISTMQVRQYLLSCQSLAMRKRLPQGCNRSLARLVATSPSRSVWSLRPFP